MVFELFQKLNLQIYASQFMTSQIIQVWKEGKNYKNMNVSRTKRASIKKLYLFILFEGLSFGEKIKI